MIRPATVSRLALIMAIRRLMSCPLAFDISCLTRRTSAKLFIGSLLLQQFQGGHENRVSDPQYSVDTTDMSECVRVRQVATVPRHEKIAAVKRCCREVEGVALRLVGHHAMSDGRVDDFGDCFIQIDTREVGDESQRRIAVWEVAAASFGIHGKAGHELIRAGAGGIEPSARPIAAGKHFGLGPRRPPSCSADCSAARSRGIWQGTAPKNRTRGHHSGYRGFRENHAGFENRANGQHRTRTCDLHGVNVAL